MTRAERVIAFIERHCRTPEGKDFGKPIVLDEFQRRFIFEVYDNEVPTELAILSTAKKNGKTTFIACLVLCHVDGPEAIENSQVVSGAMSREQAGLIFDHAVKMIRLNGLLARRIRVVMSRKRLYGLVLNVEFRALAAVAKSTQGISPALAILDEVGQVKGPKSEFVDAIITAQGAYEGALAIIISVQAAEDTDLLSLYIDDAKDAKNPHTVCHVYEAPKDCPLDDREAWGLANPALGSFRSLSDMAKLAEKAKRIPSFTPTFRNYNLNQRTETVSPFITRDVWRLGDRDLIPHNGLVPIWGGLDLSATTDLTAFAAEWLAGGQWNAMLLFWTPEQGLEERSRRDKVDYGYWVNRGFLMTTPGPTVDYDFVAADILEATADMDLRGIAFDRWRIEVFKAALKRKDATDAFLAKMSAFGQGWKDMSPAIDAIETEALHGRVAHGGHPVLAMCARNARVIKDEAGNRKFNKGKRVGPDDGMVALAMAQGLAAKNMKPADPPKHQLFVL